MGYLNGNQGPDEYTLVTKEVARVRMAGSNSVTKGDLVPILPFAPDQDLAKGGWRFAAAPLVNKGAERIWGVALEDAGPNEYARVQIAGVCKVNAVGKLSDTTTQSSLPGGLVQGTALTCGFTTTNLVVSCPAYEATTDDAVLAIVLFGAQDVVARNATGQTTVLLAGPTFPQRSL